MIMEKDKTHNPNLNKLIPIEIPLVVNKTIYKDRPTSYIGVELRKRFINDDMIKILVWSAMNNVPLYIQPKFHDKLKSLSSLLEKGILYREKESGELKFTI